MRSPTGVDGTPAEGAALATAKARGAAEDEALAIGPADDAVLAIELEVAFDVATSPVAFVGSDPCELHATIPNVAATNTKRARWSCFIGASYQRTRRPPTLDGRSFDQGSMPRLYFAAMVKKAALACIVGLSATLGLVGCQKEDPKSPDDIDSTQGSYAATYADKVTRLSKLIHTREAKAKEDIGSMPTFSEQLGDDAPPDKVIAIVDAADGAGRDGAYGEEARKLASVQAFFDDEKDPISKKAGAAAAYTVKQKSCDVDVWGPVAQGVKDGFDDRVKDRYRKYNDAFLLIDQERDALGKKNVAALEEESDKIAEASYIVFVEIPDKRKRLEYLIQQFSKERDALNKLVVDEKDRQSKEKLKPEDQKTSDAHIKEWNDALGLLDSTEKDAKDNDQDIDGRLEALERDYKAGFSAMKDAIKAGKKK